MSEQTPSPHVCLEVGGEGVFSGTYVTKMHRWGEVNAVACMKRATEIFLKHESLLKGSHLLLCTLYFHEQPTIMPIQLPVKIWHTLWITQLNFRKIGQKNKLDSFMVSVMVDVWVHALSRPYIVHKLRDQHCTWFTLTPQWSIIWLCIINLCNTADT